MSTYQTLIIYQQVLQDVPDSMHFDDSKVCQSHHQGLLPSKAQTYTQAQDFKINFFSSYIHTSYTHAGTPAHTNAHLSANGGQIGPSITVSNIQFNMIEPTPYKSKMLA